MSFSIDVNDIVKMRTDCFNGGYALNWRKSNKMCYFVLPRKVSQEPTSIYSHVLTQITKHVEYQN